MDKKKNTTCQERYPVSKDKPQEDNRKDTIMIKSNPIHTRWATYKLEWFSHRSKSSEPHIRLPSLGVWQQKDELVRPQRMWP